MHRCRESVEDGIKHLITLTTRIFKGGVRGARERKERKELLAFGAPRSWAACAFPQSRVGSPKAGQSLPGHGLGILLLGPGSG